MKLGIFRRLFKREPKEEIPLSRRSLRGPRDRSNINEPPKVPRPSPPPHLLRYRPNNDRPANTSARGAEEHF